MKELTLEEAALAWAQGKRVEAKPWTDLLGCEWSLIIPVGGGVGHYNAIVFSEPHIQRYIFRLAPEPPAKKFRPWTPEEVPVGCVLVRLKLHPYDIGIIIASAVGGILVSSYSGGILDISLSKALETREYSIDNGKTWLPCGVEVDA